MLAVERESLRVATAAADNTTRNEGASKRVDVHSDLRPGLPLTTSTPGSYRRRATPGLRTHYHRSPNDRLRRPRSLILRSSSLPSSVSSGGRTRRSPAYMPKANFFSGQNKQIRYQERSPGC